MRKFEARPDKRGEASIWDVTIPTDADCISARGLTLGGAQKAVNALNEYYSDRSVFYCPICGDRHDNAYGDTCDSCKERAEDARS